MKKYPLIVLTGPTATGKTRLASILCEKINGEIISADSRQVYKEMNLGTGKDYDDYNVDGIKIPHHLIDIVEPGYEYSVFEFQRDFKITYLNLQKQNKNIVLCGGTGFYIEAALGIKQYEEVKENAELRKVLSNLSNKELTDKLKVSKTLHNISDTGNRERLLRAVEIELLKSENIECFKPEKYIVFLICLPREEIKNRISKRLQIRLNSGLIEEVERLMKNGISYDKMKYYGLEYKFIAAYLQNELSYMEMHEKLNNAISQFAKRQTTWFKRMERQGVSLCKINGLLPENEKVNYILNELEKYAE